MHELSHLDELEAEAIYIIREVAAECEKPVMLYSIGKDSSVMLHLAMKAFYPEKPPFPFLHIDTTWKFKDMIVSVMKLPRSWALRCWSTPTKKVSSRASTPLTTVQLIPTS